MFAELAVTYSFDELREAIGCPRQASSARTVSSYRAGQRVQVWSNSAQRWEDGEVTGCADTDPHHPPYLTVRYGDPSREKLLDEAAVRRDFKAEVERDLLPTNQVPSHRAQLESNAKTFSNFPLYIF